MLKHVWFIAVGLVFSLYAAAKDGEGIQKRPGLGVTTGKVITNYNSSSTMNSRRVNCWNRFKSYGMTGPDDIEFREKSSSDSGSWFSRLFSRSKKTEPLDENKEYEMYVQSNQMANWETPVVIITPDGKKVAVKLSGNGNNCNIDKAYASSEEYLEKEVFAKEEVQKDIAEKGKKLSSAQRRLLAQDCPPESRDRMPSTLRGVTEKDRDRPSRTQENENGRPSGGGNDGTI